MISKRTLINAGVPILLYVPGAIYIIHTRWGEQCAAPCTMLFTEPLEQTFWLAESIAGGVGKSVLTLIVAAWILNFVNQIARGSNNGVQQ